jgi:hypothetical protein
MVQKSLGFRKRPVRRSILTRQPIGGGGWLQRTRTLPSGFCSRSNVTTRQPRNRDARRSIASQAVDNAVGDLRGEVESFLRDVAA